MAITDNQRKYLNNMAAGKTSTGGAASSGQQTWANSQLAKVPAPVETKTPSTMSVPHNKPVPAYKPMSSHANKPVTGSAVPKPTHQPQSTISSPQYTDWIAKQNEAFSRLENMMNTPFQYNPETDPGYQAQRQLAQLRAGDATRNALETANEKGILGSSMNRSDLGQIQQRAEQEAAAYIPEYRQQAYGQYQDRLANAASLLGQARNLRGDRFNEAVTEGQMTGNYVPEEAKPLMNNLFSLKRETEANWDNLTPEQQAAARSQADGIRYQLQGMGIDAELFGADVTSDSARGNMGRAGLRTMDGQRLDYSQMADQRDYDRGILESDRAFDRGVLESDRGFNEDLRRYDQEFEYTQGRDAVKDAQWEQEFQRVLRQDGIDNALRWANHSLSAARESRLRSGGGGSSGGGSSSGSSQGVITNTNMPKNASTMETWLLNNLPGGNNKIQGPIIEGVSNGQITPSQMEWLETNILLNDNLSDPDKFKLYHRFGIPLPKQEDE